MEPAVVVEGARVFLGDCRDVLKTLPDNSVDSIVTDPPYGLGFMGKKWDTFGGKTGITESVASEIQGRYREKAPGTPRYAGTARPAKPSDGEMLAFQLWCTEWAVECLRVLKPGGHILAFGGTRTWHRLAVAIEDAGFEIRDNIAWIYGSGFPKSLDVSKAIDKRGGSGALLTKQIGEALRVARESRGISKSKADEIFCDGTTNWTWFEGRPAGQRPPTPETFARILAEWPELADLSEKVAEAEREVIGQRSFVRNTQSWETTAGMLAPGLKEINETLPATSEAQKWQGWGTALKPAFEPVVVGRKPVEGTVANNVLLWGVGGLNIDGSRIAGEKIKTTNGSKNDIYGDLSATAGQSWESAPQGRWPANVVLDEFTAGLLDEQSGVLKSGAVDQSKITAENRIYGALPKNRSKVFGASEGGASRFFYQAKASKRDRNEGLDGMPERGKVFNGQSDEPSGNASGSVEDKFSTSPSANHHPTVKPTALMRYLIKLVTPPGGTVLDPFTGSGSTGKAALLDGYGFIGAELTEEYLPIIEGRLRWAVENRDEETLF